MVYSHLKGTAPAQGGRLWGAAKNGNRDVIVTKQGPHNVLAVATPLLQHEGSEGKNHPKVYANFTKNKFTHTFSLNFLI